MKAPKALDPRPASVSRSVGVDLGLKEFLVTSDGDQIAVQRLYRELEPKLAIAQRARNKNRVKMANRHKDVTTSYPTLVSKKRNTRTRDPKPP